MAQLRSHLLPKAPAVVGLCVGWWIANKAMTFWLPLLAAALCAYLGERIGTHYRGRESPGRGRI